jgi:hypothetical protein
MTSYDDWYPSKYFKADDVIDNPRDLTITGIVPEKMQDGVLKPVVHFKEHERGAVLNVTNKNFLIMATHSKNPADAVGLRITLVAVPDKFQGRPCYGLRFQRPVEIAPQPQPAPKTAKRKPSKDDDMGGDSIQY